MIAETIEAVLHQVKLNKTIYIYTHTHTHTYTYIYIYTLTLVHTSLVQILRESERFRLVRCTFLFDAGPQLILQLVANFSECVHAGLVVRDDGRLEETAASEIVKVVARLHLGIHVLQQPGG